MGAEQSTELSGANFDFKRPTDAKSESSASGVRAPLRSILRQTNSQDGEDSLTNSMNYSPPSASSVRAPLRSILRQTNSQDGEESLTNSMNYSPPSARRSVVWDDEHKEHDPISNQRAAFYKAANVQKSEPHKALQEIQIHSSPKWNSNENIQWPVVIDMEAVRKKKRRAPQPPEKMSQQQHKDSNEDRIQSNGINSSLSMNNLRVKIERDRLLNEIKIGLSNKPKIDFGHTSELHEDVKLHSLHKNIPSSFQKIYQPIKLYSDPTRVFKNDIHPTGFNSNQSRSSQRDNQPTGFYNESNRSSQRDNQATGFYNESNRSSHRDSQPTGYNNESNRSSQRNNQATGFYNDSNRSSQRDNQPTGFYNDSNHSSYQDSQPKGFYNDSNRSSQRDNQPMGFYNDSNRSSQRDNQSTGIYSDSHRSSQRDNQPMGFYNDSNRSSQRDNQSTSFYNDSNHFFQRDMNNDKIRNLQKINSSNSSREFDDDTRRAYQHDDTNFTHFHNKSEASNFEYKSEVNLNGFNKDLSNVKCRSEAPILKLHSNFKAKRQSPMPVILVSNNRTKNSVTETRDLDHIQNIISTDGAVTNIFHDPSLDIESTGTKFTEFIETNQIGREIEQSIVIMPAENDGLPKTEETMIYQFLADSRSHQENVNDSMEELDSQTSHLSVNSSGYESQFGRVEMAVQTSDDLLAAALEHKRRRFLPQTPIQIDETDSSNSKIQFGSSNRQQTTRDSSNRLLKLRPPQFSGLPQISQILVHHKIVLPTEEDRIEISTITRKNKSHNSSLQNEIQFESPAHFNRELDQTKALNKFEEQNHEHRTMNPNRNSWNSLKRIGNSISKIFGSLKVHGSRERGSINNVFEKKTSQSVDWNYGLTGSFHDLSSAEMMPSNSTSKEDERRLQNAWRDVARQSHQDLYATNPLFQPSNFTEFFQYEQK